MDYQFKGGKRFLILPLILPYNGDSVPQKLDTSR